MLIIGILALLQITFLPGFIILLLIRQYSGVIRTLLFALGISSAFNYLLVSTLVACNLYTVSVMLLFFLFELLLLYILLKRAYNTRQQSSRPSLYKSIKQQIITQELGVWRLIFLFLAIMSLYPCLQFLLKNPQEVFHSRDALLNWNRWAIDWFQGTFPLKTWNYPQLLPANWSITYKFMGSTIIQGFAKTLAPLFLLGIIAGLFDLAIRLKNFSYIIAISFASYLLWKMVGLQGSFNYADLPSAFFGFLAIYILLTATKEEFLQKYLWLGVVFSAASALTKQSGIYIAAIYPLAEYFVVLHREKLSKLTKAKLISMHYIALIMLVAPWYMYKSIYSDLALHMPHTLFGLFSYFAQSYNVILGHAWPLIVGVFVILAIIGAISNRKILTLLLLFLPYVVIWFAKYSYDTRNLALFIIILSMAAGFGTEHLIKKTTTLHKYLKRHRLLTIVSMAILVTAALLTLSKIYNVQWLVKRQQSKEISTICSYPLNMKLYSYFNKYDYGNMLTNNYCMQGLPKIKNYVFLVYYTNPAKLKKILAKHKIKYLFINKLLLAQRLAAINKQLDMQQFDQKTYATYYNTTNNYIDNKISTLFKKHKTIFADKYFLFIKVQDNY